MSRVVQHRFDDLILRQIPKMKTSVNVYPASALKAS
jgi:hypothetical protein